MSYVGPIVTVFTNDFTEPAVAHTIRIKATDAVNGLTGSKLWFVTIKCIKEMSVTNTLPDPIMYGIRNPLFTLKQAMPEYVIKPVECAARVSF